MATIDDTSNTGGHLIGARKVQGTTVYSVALEKLGTLQDVMIDKSTGRIAYAVLSCGGFLGIGDHYYPLPWEKLSYNPEMGGYIIDIDRDALQGAPSYADEAAAAWHDKTWGEEINEHYGLPPRGIAGV
jgi:sporulation protein YlmC with PRC-barrel domain